MRTRRAVLGLVATAWVLGCAGLAGVGRQLGAVEATPGQPFSFEARASEVPGTQHRVFLDYELTCQRAYRISGDLTVRRRGGRNARLPVEVARGCAAMDDGQGEDPKRRVGGGWARRVVPVADLPAVAPGERLEFTGQLDVTPGTRVKRMRLILSD